MLKERIELLIAEIKKAFAEMRYPKHIGYPSDIADLVGKQWHELSVNDVLSNYNFFLLSDDGFKYLLPGYMVVMLQNPKKMSESFVINGILRHLSQEYSELPKRELCKLFDKDQQQTIIMFLNVFEAIWLASEDIEKRVSKVNPQKRAWARKELEKKRQESLNLLEKAKQYWQQCK